MVCLGGMMFLGNKDPLDPLDPLDPRTLTTYRTNHWRGHLHQVGEEFLPSSRRY